MKRILVVTCAAAALLIGFMPESGAIEADEFDELVGYTVLAASEIVGVSDGHEESSVVRLTNRMAFDVSEDASAYRREPVAVFAMTLDPEAMRRIGMKRVPSTPLTIYKLLIEDQLHDADRLR